MGLEEELGLWQSTDGSRWPSRRGDKSGDSDSCSLRSAGVSRMQQRPRVRRYGTGGKRDVGVRPSRSRSFIAGAFAKSSGQHPSTPHPPTFFNSRPEPTSTTMASKSGEKPEPRNPDVVAAAKKAKEWLYAGKKPAQRVPRRAPKPAPGLLELTPASELVSQGSRSVVESPTTIAAGSKAWGTPGPDEVSWDAAALDKVSSDTAAPDKVSTLSNGGAPIITPKEAVGEVQSPRDQGAPSPKPLSTIVGALSSLELAIRKKASSTISLSLTTSFDQGDPSQEWGLVRRDPAQGGVENDWGDDAEAKKFERQFQSQRFVSKWIDEVADAPGVDMSLVMYQDPDTRDIDTFTGDFAEWFEYPHTMKNIDHMAAMDDPKVMWRQENMTAALHMKGKEAGEKVKIMEDRQDEALAAAQAMVPMPLPEVEWPKADCVLRPLERDDFEAVAGIINLEAKDDTCPLVINKDPVVARDVCAVYRDCVTARYPFIVAVTSKCPLLDRSKWPKGSEREYQEYVKFKKSQPLEKEKVLGFAFVTAPRRGILNAPCHGSRHGGEIKILVHPDHRGHLAGTALLDRVLMSVDVRHRSLVDYDWKCDQPAGVYEKQAANNHRRFAWVDIVTFCRHGDEDLSRRQGRFVEKYGFEAVSRLEEEVKLDRGHGSAWLDVKHWRKEVQERGAMTDIGQKLNGMV